MAPFDSTSAQPASARVLLALAWPIVLARATQAVVGFSDALMVAPLGEETLAAVTTGALDTFAFVMLPMARSSSSRALRRSCTGAVSYRPCAATRSTAWRSRCWPA